MSTRAPSWLALSAATWLAVGCAGTPSAGAPATGAAVLPSASSNPPAQPNPGGTGAGDSGGQGRHGGQAASAPALPADFPAEVPVPPGTLQGGSGSAGRWGLLVLVRGPADQVLRSSVAFYVAAGFTADGPSTVHRGPYQVVLVAENRDHSNTETNLAAGITRR